MEPLVKPRLQLYNVQRHGVCVVVCWFVFNPKHKFCGFGRCSWELCGRCWPWPIVTCTPPPSPPPSPPRSPARVPAASPDVKQISPFSGASLCVCRATETREELQAWRGGGASCLASSWQRRQCVSPAAALRGQVGAITVQRCTLHHLQNPP